MADKKVRIVLRKPEVKPLCGVVRIGPEAEKKIIELMQRTGLPAKEIVSQIIVQSAELVEIAR